MYATPLLLANIADASTRTRYELARVESMTQWWQLPLVALVCLLVVAYVAYMYRRDSVELKPGVGVLLALLRVAAFGGLLLAYLDVQRRTETKVVHNSRVLVLVDTSLSMARADTDDSQTTSGPRRIDQVADVLVDGTFLESLRRTHDVTVARFDTQLHRIATLPRSASAANDSGAATAGEAGKQDDPGDEADGEPARQPPSETIDWRAALEPQGQETRIADAVRQMIYDQRGSPISAVIVLTDGSQNAGVDLAAAIQAAQEAKIPVHAVGLGSARQPASVRLSDLVAPARAYPNDGFRVTGYLQSRGLNGRQVSVDLAVLDAAASSQGEAPPLLEKTELVTLAGDAEAVPVRFDLPSLQSSGRRVIRMRIKPLPEDRDQSDNQQEVEVDVVDRKNHVLLFAGGPSREYQFLRNMLRRSELAQSGDMVVDVLLQSATSGVSQDANAILDEFPRTMQELAEYDTIVAFDPDWRELDADQLQLLDRWVGEESGGLIAIAGPVFTDAWVQDPAMAPVRALYPVEFNRRLLLLDDARFGSQEPWPLDFTREGLEAEFLWLEDNAAASQEVWSSFPGVYGYYRVRGAKPAATTYALFSDPEAAIGDQKPVYLAGHFYGAGRVFYLGSGEMWRLRELDDRYFDTFYTKLIRHVSQGRLLRGSRLGMLLVERERYLVGNTVVVRAQLSTRQHKPLEEPSVTLTVRQRDAAPLSVSLAADPLRKGMYSGQFTVTREGECRLELAHPESPDDVLTRRIQVFIPKLEQQQPERNDKLLKELADGTGGLMYVGLAAAIGPNSERPLVAQLEDRTQETYVSGKKDREWERMWMHFLLGLIAGCLATEWLVRRMFRLA